MRTNPTAVASKCRNLAVQFAAEGTRWKGHGLAQACAAQARALNQYAVDIVVYSGRLGADEFYAGCDALIDSVEENLAQIMTERAIGTYTEVTP